MEQKKQIIAEDDKVRQLKTMDLENVQKIDNFGAAKWPSQSDIRDVSEKCNCQNSKSPTDGDLTSDIVSTTGKLSVTKIPSSPVKVAEKSLPGEWTMDITDYLKTLPGYFGFNGHQVIFHCYQPGKPYLSRNACADKCLLKLGNLDTGEQSCSIIYDKPPPPPTKLHRFVCTTDRQTNVVLQDFCPKSAVSKATAVDEGSQKGDGDKKAQKQNKKDEKGKKKK